MAYRFESAVNKNSIKELAANCVKSIRNEIVDAITEAAERELFLEVEIFAESGKLGLHFGTMGAVDHKQFLPLKEIIEEFEEKFNNYGYEAEEADIPPIDEIIAALQKLKKSIEKQITKHKKKK
jgi:uncharacterized protein YdhG (YjbR/CyaY superfamily)